MNPPEVAERDKVRKDSAKKAVALAMGGKWEEAARLNRSILDEFPRDLEAYNRLGKALSELGKNREAREAFQNALEISPQDFALSYQRRNILCKYGLDSFYQRVYNCKMAELFADVFPSLEPHQVRARNRWRGRQGLLNAYNAVGWLARTTGKRPSELVRKDFAAHKLEGALKVWFEDSYQRAVEFRFPGTYACYAEQVNVLWQALGASS